MQNQGQSVIDTDSQEIQFAAVEVGLKKIDEEEGGGDWFEEESAMIFWELNHSCKQSNYVAKYGNIYLIVDIW